MSAVESDLNVTDDNRVDDDDDDDEEDGWLYGDCIEEKAEERTADSVTETLDPSDTHDNGVKTQETDKDGDTTSDDDDDDDVCVTIGDIKTGGLSQSISFGSTPVTLNIKGEGRTHALVSSKCKGLDVDPVGKAIEVESFDEKPWRRPGSDISDYFNYGFNEETWRVYCEKQRRLHASNDSASRASAKLAVQRGRPDHGDKGSHSEDSTSSGSLLYRKSSGSIGVIGGLNGPISRSSGSRLHGNEVNTIQVLSETRSDGERPANQAAAFFPPSVPPPPLLSPPPNVSSAPPLIPPPRYPPPPLIPSLDSGRPGGYSGPPPPPYPFTPGLYAPPPGGVASWSGAMDSAKAWEHYVRRDRERKRDTGRDGSRERLSHSKDRERGRDTPNSEEERVRHRVRAQRSSERHRNSGSRDRVEDDTSRRDWRRRDKDEGRHKTSHRSSRRRRDDSEEDDDLRRRRKKAKRSRERSTDQENQTEDNQ